MSKLKLKSLVRLVGFSDGSFTFLLYSGNSSYKRAKSVDVLNHSLWAGGKQSTQNKVSFFVSRLNTLKKSLNSN